MSYKIFEDLCEKANTTPYKVGKATGIPTATFSNWKAGRYEPKSDKRQRIADYFGVSLYYLDTGIDAPETLQLSLELMQIVEPFIKRPGAKHFMQICNDLNDTQYLLVMQLCKQLAYGGANDKNTENTPD